MLALSQLHRRRCGGPVLSRSTSARVVGTSNTALAMKARAKAASLLPGDPAQCLTPNPPASRPRKFYKRLRQLAMLEPGERTVRSIGFRIAFFLLACTCSAAEVVETLTRCEDLSGWSRRAELSSDAYEGQSAVVASIPSDRAVFLTYDFVDTDKDISNRHSLSFWWKTEGNGLRDLKIRVRNSPLAGGREVAFTIWSGQTSPKGWQLAVVDLAEPIDGSAGQQPDQFRRYITFRAASSQHSAVRLFIDHIVAMDRTFSWKVRAPRKETYPSPWAGYGADQYYWNIPIEFQNHATQPLRVSVGSEAQTLSTQTILPGPNLVTVSIHPDFLQRRFHRSVAHPDFLDGLDDTGRILLWAQVAGYSHTRRHWTSQLRQGGLSRTWEQFVSAKQAGTEPILPDYSYAGYRYFGEPVPDVTHPVFDVADYGAVANDGLSDQSAIVNAIAAAEASGGGIVFFPPGEFLVNTDADRNSAGAFTPIYVRGSRTILRGSGSRQGGTVIRQVNYMPPTDDNLLYSSPYMFVFKPRNASSRTLATITESASRETFWLTVSETSRLRVGQWVRLHMNNTGAVEELLAPRLPEELSARIRTEGVNFSEEHSIAEIQGNRIRLNEALHTNVYPGHGWTVRSFPHLEEVGVEDISFHGSFRERFVHHKNAIHDGGWSLLKLVRCVNSWVRRASFINTNRALSIIDSAAVSVYHVTLAGNGGHAAINSQNNYGTWIGLSEDLAGHLHGVGMSHNATGTVFWRVDMSPGQSLDIHKTNPSYANLYDQVANGRLYGSSGGGIPPHHLKHLVFWNFNHGGNDTYYDFWQGYLRFLNPIIVGFHGNPATFNESSLEVLESNGTAMEPASLFEAQLRLRLQTIPFWIDDLRSEWETLRDTPLPDFPMPEAGNQ